MSTLILTSTELTPENLALYPVQMVFEPLTAEVPTIAVSDHEVSVKYEPDHPLFVERLSHYREMLSDSDIEIADRLKAAGILLFEFTDIKSLQVGGELLQSRADYVEETKEHDFEHDNQEHIAWLRIMLGKSLFDDFSEEDIFNFLRVSMVNGLDSGFEHATNTVNQAFAVLNIILMDNVRDKRTPFKEVMTAAIGEVSSSLVDVTSRLYGVLPEVVLKSCESYIEDTLPSRAHKIKQNRLKKISTDLTTLQGQFLVD